MSPSPRVFSIPSGIAFLPALADAVLDGTLVEFKENSDFSLSDLTIYLPTRRSVHRLETLFADRLSGKAALLPRIYPLGETDEAEFDLAFSQNHSESTALAPAISPLERRLTLARLIRKWAQSIDQYLIQADHASFHIPDSPSDALKLARDLELLMDGFTIENIPWSNIREAVEADYSEYFLLTLEFVRIAHEMWPQILNERQASDPVQRRNTLLLAETDKLQKNAPPFPVIAAGSTGSQPATARLLSAISHLPNGAVVLPGLDFNLDKPSFDMIGKNDPFLAGSVQGHPQAMMHRLITHYIKIDRDQIQQIGISSSSLNARRRFISEALRPADTTELWAQFNQSARMSLVRDARQGLSIIEAADEREEALSIAVALRETLEDKEKTAIFVTPDRNLAKRVRADLQLWGINAEDTAGEPLSETQPGLLARLVCEAAFHEFDALSLLALLHHPMLSCNMPAEHLSSALATLELGVLRGPEPDKGLSGLKKALYISRDDNPGREPLPVRRLTEDDWQNASDLLNYLEEAFSTFQIRNVDETSLTALASSHRSVIEKLILSPSDKESGTDNPPFADALAILFSLFDDLDMIDPDIFTGKPLDYPGFFLQLAQQRTIPSSSFNTHKRIKIMGLLEARLLSADRIILGGLDEGVWPPRIETDAFLNRPMRAAVGLSSPERRIGQTAHDFSQLASHPDVIITHALKRDGAPAMPSRFLQRMRAFAGEHEWALLTDKGQRYILWASALEERPRPETAARPAPQSRSETFPSTLSITEIETLIRDPYAIFARHILKLEPLPAFAEPPGAAERGTLIHDIFNRFVREFPLDIPDHAEKYLMDLADDCLAPYRDVYPHLYAEWHERIQRIIAPYCLWERERRPYIRRIYTECAGYWSVPLSDGQVFRLRGRADRIELNHDGSMNIIDFKTGSPPGIKEVLKGFSPQLTLEAIMLQEGAFDGSPSFSGIPNLFYIHVSGGKTPFDIREITADDKNGDSLAQVIQRHKSMILAMINRFASGRARYVSRPYAKYTNRFSPYDHLARVLEWSLNNEGAEE